MTNHIYTSKRASTGTPKKNAEQINQALSGTGRTVHLIGEYINTDTPTTFQCLVCQHQWKARPYTITGKRQSGCPHCSLRARGLKRRRNLEDVIHKLKAKGIELVGKYDIGKLRFRCIANGHEWESHASSIINGATGCPQCYRNEIYTADSINSQLKLRGIQMTGLYKGIARKTEFTCNAGHIWESWPSIILNGTGCRQCFVDRITGNVEEINATLTRRGLRIISDFKNARTPAQFHCDVCSGMFYATPDNIKRGKGCPHCYANATRRTEDSINEQLANRNITLIGEYINTNSKALFRCGICALEWRALPALVCGIKETGCPACAVSGFKADKPASLYILISDDGQYIKIGISNEPKKRIRILRRATPFTFSVIAIYRHSTGSSVAHLERDIHALLKPYLAGLNGFDAYSEWFKAVRPVLDFVSLL